MRPGPSPTNEFAVVTGVSGGIGFELAKQFARHGYDLLIAAEDGRARLRIRSLTRT
jgi:NAD(P)-dependent dehydrogenase (short-subunit alcohol dehydrogenase family)